MEKPSNLQFCDELKYLTNSYKGISIRHKVVKTSAWFLLTAEVAILLSDLIKGKRVVEVLAGTGFLAHHLRELSGLSREDYRAYDNRSSHYDRKDANYGVTIKNALNSNLKQADVVIMTWPPYAEKIGERIVKKMRKGQILIYNGENQGGCCGNDQMFDHLDSHFIKHDITDELEDYHTSYFGIRDEWAVYIKVK